MDQTREIIVRLLGNIGLIRDQRDELASSLSTLEVARRPSEPPEVRDAVGEHGYEELTGIRP